MSQALLRNSEKTITTTTTVEDLLDEVLEFVFGFLSLADRKRARLVCKRWMHISNRPSVTRNDVIVLKRYAEFGHCNILRPNLKFLVKSKTESLFAFDEFWKRHGVLVKSVEIATGCTLDCSANDFYHKIGFCPNIEFLSLGHSSYPEGGEVFDKFYGTFDRLTSLEVCPDRMKDILRFTISRTRLKRFGLSSVEDEQVVEIFLFFIATQASLEQIYLGNCQFASEHLFNQIVDLLGPNLRGLHIPCKSFLKPYCGPMSAQFLLKLADKFALLEELDLGCHGYFQCFENNSLLASALYSFQNLKYLSLVETQIRDNALVAVAAFPQLRGLDLSCCKCLTADGFFNAFVQTQHPKLLQLRLQFNFWVTDDFLGVIIPQFPNLRSLHLDGCTTITSNGLSAIFDGCNMLTCLSLAYCYIKSLVSPFSINSMKSLTYLNIGDCLQLEDTTLNLLKLPALRFLNLRRVPLTEQMLILLGVNCPSLDTVHLNDERYFFVNSRTFTWATNKNCFIKIKRRCKDHVSIFDSFKFFRKMSFMYYANLFLIEPIEPQCLSARDDVSDDSSNCVGSCVSFCKCQ